MTSKVTDKNGGGDGPLSASSTSSSASTPQPATSVDDGYLGGQGGGTTPVDLDALLPYIGEMGRYQMVFYLLMCVPTMPAAFLAFNQVFLSAEPEHWCHVSAFDRLHGPGGPLNQTQRKLLSLPRRQVGENMWRYHSCRQYDVNFTEVFEGNGNEWPEGPDPEWNTTECADGWVYDRSEFVNTLVTEVS